MKASTALFYADCLNALFDHDKPYIVAMKYEDPGRGGIEIHIERFGHAICYEIASDPGHAVIRWSDSSGTYSAFEDQAIEIDYPSQCIKITGWIRTGEKCWYTLRRMDTNRYREFVQWDEKSWGQS